MSTTSDKHRSLGRLVPRLLARPFVVLARWYRSQPRVVRVGLAVVLVVGTAAVGVYVRWYVQKRAGAAALAAAWREVEEAVNRSDRSAARAALERVLAAAPGDPTATRYRDLLDRGSADPDTPELALLLMADHLRADRLADAAREAEKVLARYPQHWHARCCLAHAAWQIDRDPARAAALLRELPDPEDPAAGVTVGGVLYALRLYEVVGTDATPLRQVVVRRLLPLLRTPAVSNAPPAAQAQLLACYLEPFADPTTWSDLADFWAAADKLAEDAVTRAVADPATELRTLIDLGGLCFRLRGALARLRDHDPARLPDDRFIPLQRAVDDRTRRVWEAVRGRRPDRPEAYRGLAQLALVRNDPAAAVRALLDGIAACGDRPELLDLLLGIVAQVGTSESLRELAAAVWQSAEAANDDPVRWCLAAMAAELIGRADLALAAGQKARGLRPDDPWACGTEARLWVRAGDFARAAEALAPLGEAVYARPSLARLRGRILVGCGLWVLRDDELTRVRRASPRDPAAVVAFLWGVHDAPADADRAAWVAAQTELLLAEFPEAPAAARLRAEALFRLAELSAARRRDDGSPPVWNAERVAAALRAFDQLPPAERAEPGVLAAVALLQLKGKGDAAAALRTLTGLLRPEAPADPRQLEAVGAVLLAHDRVEEAVRVLEAGRRRLPRVTAGCHITLGLAYLRQGRWAEAAARLAAAQNCPDRSDREQAELIAAKLRLLQEKP